MDKDFLLLSKRKHLNYYLKWEFKFQKKHCEKSQDGINWYLYRKKKFSPKFYLFCEKVAQETGKKVWLIEDNAFFHFKTAANQEEKHI